MAFNSYMHERNIYRNQPDFAQIALDFPLFRKYAIPDAKGKKVRVDFSDPDALRMVTEILLKKDFNLDIEIPQGFLIPTVPQRLNYILWLEDLLNNIPEKKFVCGIDIGTGPCAIFSILGARKNDWNFIATESSEDAIHWAEKNIEKNNLKDNIKIVKVSPGTTLSEILSSNEENYDFCLCNPPFFENIEEIRKKHHNSNETIADVAQKEEIFFEGGELNFVKNILSDSVIYKDRICLFTSMFGKKRSFLQILKEVKELKDAKVTTTEFCQGNTVRWGIAWTFNESIHFEEVVKRKIKAKKVKPPLEYQIPLKNSKTFNLDILLEQTKSFIKSLQISLAVTKSSQYFAEILLKSDKNTWTHQRRKRREIERQKKERNGLGNQLSVLSVSEASHGQVDPSDLETPGQNICSSIDTSISKVNKDDVTSENNNVCSDTKDVSEHHMNDTYIVSSESHKMDVPGGLSSESNVLELESPNKISLNNKRKYCSHENSSINKKSKLHIDEKNESICSEQCTNIPLELSKYDIKSSKNKCDKNGEICSESISNSTNQSSITDNSKIEQNDEQKDIRDEGLSVNKKSELDTEEGIDNISTEQGSVLHCHLQLIKGKNKIYVKMNCPPTADRNTMYQVFQLIKNKIK